MLPRPSLPPPAPDRRHKGSRAPPTQPRGRRRGAPGEPTPPASGDVRLQPKSHLPGSKSGMRAWYSAPTLIPTSARQRRGEKLRAGASLGAVPGSRRAGGREAGRAGGAPAAAVRNKPPPPPPPPARRRRRGLSPAEPPRRGQEEAEGGVYSSGTMGTAAAPGRHSLPIVKCRGGSRGAAPRAPAPRPTQARPRHGRDGAAGPRHRERGRRLGSARRPSRRLRHPPAAAGGAAPGSHRARRHCRRRRSPAPSSARWRGCRSWRRWGPPGSYPPRAPRPSPSCPACRGWERGRAVAALPAAEGGEVNTEPPCCPLPAPPSGASSPRPPRRAAPPLPRRRGSLRAARPDLAQGRGCRCSAGGGAAEGRKERREGLLQDCGRAAGLSRSAGAERRRDYFPAAAQGSRRAVSGPGRAGGAAAAQGPSGDGHGAGAGPGTPRGTPSGDTRGHLGGTPRGPARGHLGAGPRPRPRRGKPVLSRR